VLGILNYEVNLYRLGNAISLWLGIQPPDLFFYAFLPPLLVDAALRLDWYIFSKVGRLYFVIMMHCFCRLWCGDSVVMVVFGTFERICLGGLFKRYLPLYITSHSQRFPAFHLFSSPHPACLACSCGRTSLWPPTLWSSSMQQCSHPSSSL
jgi:hypothetical protein